GRAAGTDASAALVIGLPGQLTRQVGVFDHRAAAINEDEIAQLIGWTLLGDNLGGHLSLSDEVLAEKERIGDVDKRVIHLEIENLLNASPLQAVQQARVHQGEQGTPMTVRTDEQPSWRLEQ